MASCKCSECKNQPDNDVRRALTPRVPAFAAAARGPQAGPVGGRGQRVFFLRESPTRIEGGMVWEGEAPRHWDAGALQERPICGSASFSVSGFCNPS